MSGPGVLADRPVRRHDGGRPAARPGPQAHRRGRHRPEHRRHGRLRPGAPGRPTRRRPRGDVRPADPRPLRGGRHAVRRRPLRRADAHARRPAPRRVQRPLRRPRGAGRCSRCSTATSPPSPSPPPHGRLDRRPMSASDPAPPAPSSPPPPATRASRAPATPSRCRPTRSSTARCCSPPGCATGSTSGGRVLAVTGIGDDLAAARADAYAAIEHVGFAGMQYRRDIGWRAPGATPHLLRRRRRRHRRGQPRRRPDARRRRAHPRRRGRPRRRQLRRRLLGEGDRGDGRPRARRLHRRRRHQGRARRVARPGRAVSATTSSTTASATCSSRRPARCSSSTTSPRASSTPTSSPRSSPGWPRHAPRPAARCSAARRRRCPASTRRARSTSPARSSASPSGRACSPAHDVAAGDVLVGVASSGPHTNGYSLLRKLFAWIPMDVTPAGLRPPARRRPARAAPQLPAGARSGASPPAAVKALAHITGGGLLENVPRVLPGDVDAVDRPRLVAGAAAVPPRRASWPRRSTTTSCTARSTWASAWSSCARRTTSTPCRRRSPRRRG